MAYETPSMKNIRGYDEGETGDDFSFQKAIRKQTRKTLRETPGVLRGAADAAKRETEAMGGKVMAHTGSRDMGALTDIGMDYRRQAANQMFKNAADIQQAEIDVLGAEAQIDTDERAAERRRNRSQDRIDEAVANAGTVGEQQAAITEIDNQLATEKDPALRRSLEAQRAELAKADVWYNQFANMFGANIGKDV